MKASQLIRDLANHISFYGDVELQFVPDLSSSKGEFDKYSVETEFGNDKKPTGRVFIEIW